MPRNLGVVWMQSEQDKILEDLIKVVRYHCAFPERPILASTIVQTDLGINGEDGYELIRDIQNQFSVDFSDFDDRYFFDELSMSAGIALWPLAFLIHPLMKLFGIGKKVEIEIQDLLDAVINGKWTHPSREPVFLWEHRSSAK